MDFFSTDPNRPGVFAVGQEAFGIFALGQIATGVIAVGQVARGVVAIGQGAVGFVAIGQGAIGVLYGGGMLAAAGRGFGITLRVLPKMVIDRFERPVLPPISALADLRSGRVDEGWLLADIERGELLVEGTTPDLEESPELLEALREATEARHTHACVRVEAQERSRAPQGGYREATARDRVLVGMRMQTWAERGPRVRFEGPLTDAGGLFLRACGMVALLAAWWILAGRDIVSMLLR